MSPSTLVPQPWGQYLVESPSQKYAVLRTSSMVGQAAESEEMTSRRPSLIAGVSATHRKYRLPSLPLGEKTNLRPGLSSSYTQHRAAASKMVFFQADIRSRHVLITDESDLREEILSSTSC